MTNEVKNKKTYILDTNILIHDCRAIFQFQENDILIPMAVLEELDNLKSGSSSVSRSARQAVRNLDDLRKAGPLSEGCPLPGGGSLRVILDNPSIRFSQGANKDYADNVIIQTIVDYIEREAESGEEVILVSKDLAMRCKAAALNIAVEDYENSMVKDASIFDGVKIISVMGNIVQDLFDDIEVVDEDGELGVNEYAVFRSNGSKASALARKYPDGVIRRVREHSDIYNLSPKNKEQVFALDALMDPSISLVALTGQSGVGKTLCALAAGLQHVLGAGQLYSKVMVARPTVSMGRELGFLPGSESEKLQPWMGPIYDSYSFLSRNSHPNMRGDKGWEYLESVDHVEVMALSFIRGRSLPGVFFIADEAQNMSAAEVKALVTRAGQGAKLVLVGDPEQVDDPFLDQYSNGLSRLIEAFEGSPLFAHIHLTKGERSPLAEEAARRL